MFDPYILEYLINSTSFFLILIIGFFVVYIVIQSTRIKNLRDQVRTLSQENDIFLKIFKNSEIPYVMVNSRGVITEINSAALELYQKSRDELVGKIFEPFIILRSSERESNNLRKAVNNNQEYIADSTIRINNQIKNCQFTIIGITYRNKERYSIGIHIYDEDIATTHDNNLRDDRINKIEEIANVGFFVFNHETNSIRWSRGMYKLLGAKINKTVPSLKFISQIQTNTKELQEIILAIQNLKPLKKEYVLKSLDGKTHVIELELSHQEGTNHSNAVTQGILRNIGNVESVINNLDLEDSYSYTPLLNDPHFFHIVLVDTKGTILDANEAFLKYLDREKGDVIGSTLGSIFEDSKFLIDERNAVYKIKYSDDMIFVKELKFKANDQKIHLLIGIPFMTEKEKNEPSKS